eukprot:EST42947.1 Hypothetical protein SS50377_17394 [Spironucleus salmonicida]
MATAIVVARPASPAAEGGSCAVSPIEPLESRRYQLDNYANKTKHGCRCAEWAFESQETGNQYGGWCNARG